MKDEKKITGQEMKKLDKEQLGSVTGGVAAPSVIKCKKCGVTLSPAVYAKNGFYCDACKP